MRRTPVAPLAAIETHCSNCGASLPRDAHFCPSCGAALAESASPVPPGNAGGRNDVARGSRRLSIAAGAIALAAAGVVLALVAGGGGGGRSDAPAVQTTTAGTAGSATRGTTGRTGTTGTSAAVTEGAIRAILRRYAKAYSAGSVAQLDALFATDFTRRNGSAPTETRAEALRSYRNQFRSGTGRYDLTIQTVIPKGSSGWALARYDIETRSGRTAGLAQFDLVASGAGLRISRLRVAPFTGAPPPKTATGSGQATTPEGSTGSGARTYTQTCRVKAWYSNYSTSVMGAGTANSTYIHFKCVDERRGTTVTEALGSDNIDLDQESSAARRTPKREELLAQLKRKLEAQGWKVIGTVPGGEWYQLRFGR